MSRAYLRSTFHLPPANVEGCTAEIDGPQRKSIIEGEDEYNACIAALKTWNTRYSEKGKELNHGH